MSGSDPIWQSARNILDSQDNLDKLCEAFNIIECDKPELAIEFYESDANNDYWIVPAWNQYYRVYRRPNGRKVHAGWITLAVQLTCQECVEDDWSYGKVAKVLAAYCPYRGYDAAWDFDAESPNSAGYFEGCISKEWHWMHQDGKSWFFAVPLSVLTSTEAVEIYVTGPIWQILAGGEPAKVLKPIVDKLCRPPESSGQSL